jgi:hypothetical protein
MSLEEEFPLVCFLADLSDLFRPLLFLSVVACHVRVEHRTGDIENEL